jgi:hypothetical protein
MATIEQPPPPHRTCSARDRHGLPLANIHDSLCTRDTGVVLEIAR